MFIHPFVSRLQTRRPSNGGSISRRGEEFFFCQRFRPIPEPTNRPLQLEPAYLWPWVKSSVRETDYAHPISEKVKKDWNCFPLFHMSSRVCRSFLMCILDMFMVNHVPSFVIKAKGTVKFRTTGFPFFVLHICGAFLPKWWLDFHQVFLGKDSRTYGRISLPPAKEIWQI